MTSTYVCNIVLARYVFITAKNLISLVVRHRSHLTFLPEKKGELKQRCLLTFFRLGLSDRFSQKLEMLDCLQMFLRQDSGGGWRRHF